MECSECGAICKERLAVCSECGARQTIEVSEPIIEKTVEFAAAEAATPETILSTKSVAEPTPAESSPPLESASEPTTPETAPPKKAAPERVKETRTQQKVEIPTPKRSSRKAVTPKAPVYVEPRRPAQPVTPANSLIEFPGVNRISVPQWRKELGDRVRQVQERKARETVGDDESFVSPGLELLPQTPDEEVNPIVLKALQRIQKAQPTPQYASNKAVAVAYQEEPQTEAMIVVEQEMLAVEETVGQEETPAEKAHNLAIVPPPAIVELEAPAVKPRRLIHDYNDPALNYLDSIPRTVVTDHSLYEMAPVLPRMLAAVVDIFFIAVMTTAALAMAGLITLGLTDPQFIAFALGLGGVIGFLYLTVNTALTGRTPGMRLFALRVVDARTGLIPTGKQCAGRAIFLLVSVATILVLFYALINRDKRAAHDQLTNTAVIRA